MRRKFGWLRIVQWGLILGSIGQGLTMFALPAMINYWTGGNGPSWMGVLSDDLLYVTMVCLGAAMVVHHIEKRVSDRSAAADEATGLSAGAVAREESEWERMKLIRSMRATWMNKVLAPSRETLPPLDVRCTEAGQPGVLLAAEQLMSRYCGNYGKLVVLGETGVGKTYFLLRLAERLLDLAENDPRAPVPVVMPLGNWREGSFADFVEDQLSDAYRVPPHVSRAWLARGRIALLLDGLDELAGTINKNNAGSLSGFLRGHPAAAVVLTCKSDRFNTYRKRFPGAEIWRLRLPAESAIRDTLTAGGENLRGLRLKWEADKSWRRALGTPLALSLAARAYRNHSAAQIGDNADRIFAAYVDTAFAAAGGLPRKLNRQVLPRGAAWLAAAMDRTSAASVRPEDIQDDWLEGFPRRFVALDLAIRVLMRVGMVTIFVVTPSLLHIPGAAGTDALFVPVTAAVMSTLTIFSAMRYFEGKIDLDQRTRFSGRVFRDTFVARFPLYTLALALFLGTLEAVGVHVPMPGMAARADSPILSALIIGGVFATISAYQVAHRRESEERPRVTASGLSRSGWTAMRSMLLTAPLTGILCWVVLGPETGLAVAALTTVALFDRNGGRFVIRHLLVRLSLVANGLTPWNIRRYLDALCTIGLMRRAPTGYLFIHASVRDYLASEIPGGRVPGPRGAPVVDDNEPRSGTPADRARH